MITALSSDEHRFQKFNCNKLVFSFARSSVSGQAGLSAAQNAVEENGLVLEVA